MIILKLKSNSGCWKRIFFRLKICKMQFYLKELTISKSQTETLFQKMSRLYCIASRCATNKHMTFALDGFVP